MRSFDSSPPRKPNCRSLVNRSGDHRGSVRRQGRDRHRRRARHRPQSRAAARVRGRGGRRQRPRRQQRRRRRRRDARAAGGRRDHAPRAAAPSPTTTASRRGRAPKRWCSRPSTRSAASTCSSTTPGILRDKMSFNMDEAEWDAVIDVHLKGHFAPSRFAASYWRAKSKETGEPVNAKIVNTASESGLYGNAGQANYAAAKAGIASMTIVMARELERIGVRVERDRTGRAHAAHRDGRGRRLHEREGRRVRPLRPENISAVVGWLASDLSAGVTGQVVKVMGGQVQLLRGLAAGHRGDRRQAVDDRRRSTQRRATLFANGRQGCAAVHARTSATRSLRPMTAPIPTTDLVGRRHPARRHRAVDAARPRGHLRQAARRSADLVPRRAGPAARDADSRRARASGRSPATPT